MSPELDKILEMFERYQLLQKTEVEEIFQQIKRALRKRNLEMMVDGLYEAFLQKDVTDIEAKIHTLVEIEIIIEDLLIGWSELSEIFPNLKKYPSFKKLLIS